VPVDTHAPRTSGVPARMHSRAKRTNVVGAIARDVLADEEANSELSRIRSGLEEAEPPSRA
jgi:hypothetical protein